jgi:SAM-dependent methyltransferase
VARPSERYEAERQQGETLAATRDEGVWGWSSPAGRLRAERRARFLTQAARLGPGIRCLELGCGSGEFTTRLLASGCALVAVDLSEASVRRCRERVGSRAEVVVGNAETGEGFEGRTFDAIVGVSVLHHVDLDACLEHTFAALEPGGRFAFSEPNAANPQVWAERTFAAFGRRRRTLPHETAFTASGLRGAFERAGYEVERCEPFEFLHPATPPGLIGFVERVQGSLEATPLRAIAGSVRIAGRRPP